MGTFPVCQLLTEQPCHALEDLPVRRPIAPTPILVVVAFCLLFGSCSRLLRYTVVGHVSDADTDRCLSGVEIRLNERIARAPRLERYGPPRTQPILPVTVGEQGDFRFTVFRDNHTALRGGLLWSLVLTKEGYETVRVDISPDPTNLPGKRALIRVIVEMRKVPNAETLRERGRERLKVGALITNSAT